MLDVFQFNPRNTKVNNINVLNTQRVILTPSKVSSVESPIDCKFHMNVRGRLLDGSLQDLLVKHFCPRSKRKLEKEGLELIPSVFPGLIIARTRLHIDTHQAILYGIHSRV